jgi:hypothetical protein
MRGLDPRIHQKEGRLGFISLRSVAGSSPAMTSKEAEAE